MRFVNVGFLILVLMISLVSCKSAERISPTRDLNYIIDSSGVSIYLSEADSVQLSGAIIECPGLPNTQCFEICHEATHETVFVSLAEFETHLHRDLSGASVKSDYLGACE